MAEDHASRRLAAILAADVVGYSRMMGVDEAGTLAALKHHRESLFDPAVAEHNGRIVKLMGDGTLVEFPSAVEAVKCALAIQTAIAAGGGVAGAGKSGIVLRMGINLGDIIIDGDDLYGDGVNVAARLEPLAEPGGICVASIVNESVGNRVDVAFEDGGEVHVKNIERPIRVWKWHPRDAAPAIAQAAPRTGKATAGTEPAAERPSIAVLPFDNMSGDPEQEYFSDGITEDIITDLSKVGGLLVIARNSSFVYKGKSVDIRTVARDLGVRSVLEGSIRRAGNRVRITAQLINAANGAHLWADRYDRDLTDIFAVQDEVTQKIVEALKVTLSPGEQARIANAPTTSIEAHDLYLRARGLLHGTKRDHAMFDQVIWLCSRAIELDPDYAEPYATLAWAHNLDFQNRWTGADDALDTAERFAALAVEKGPSVPFAHFIAAMNAFWRKDIERAKAESEVATRLSPNDALAYGMQGFVNIYAGQPLEAIPEIERSMRLDPGFAHQAMQFLATAYLVAGKYETAAATFRERIRQVPDTDLSRGLLISALGHLGETDEARRVWDELGKVNPKYSFEKHLERLPFTNPADAERIKEGFAKAGVSD